ncbi:MAG: isoleucine--tRNA ligase [Planctomycetota bacterium]|jgi:isoleucyl-tRNA synthetase
MFKEVDPKTSFIELEHRILNFWEEHRCFQKLREKNKGNPKWSFLDGPITANNPMGVHHAWGRTYKDIFQRYHAMLGHDQRYQNGFDCQGLWVEVEVEKELGFKTKRDIEDYGIDKFVKACKDRVHKFSAIQTDQSIRLGYWMDWDNSYFTMTDENNYTIWMFLKKCHEHGWIYKGDDVMPWCFRCGCALSEHEIATEGYKELKHPSVTVRFPIKEKPGESLLVWTTTPWTLTSNVAAAVHPELEYLKVKQGDEIFYLAEPRKEMLLKKPEVEILGKVMGSEMLGWTYEGPFDKLPAQHPEAHRVIAWDEVSAADGTGIVHIAPGCGKEDYALGKEENLPAIAPLDELGVYIPGFDWLSGRNVSELTDEILKDLKERKILYRKETITHRYPVCWRCNTELVFRLVDEWFIKMDELRHQIKDVARKIRWIPAFGLERELDWLDNMHDWCISKKRFWGLALPIYECDCGHFDVIGSETELEERAVEGWDRFEGNSPHRPWVDEVKIACAKCGEKVSRILDVGNPWLDAGIVPYSTMGYRNQREYWEEWFPPAFITESFPGQFRNWFYSLLAMSTVMENREPFECVFGYAMMRDEDGQEMHKSAGNAIWFEDAAEKMGVDVMRWIFAAHNPQQNLNFGYKTADDYRRRILTLWNTYSFFVTYANVDNYDPKTPAPSYEERSVLDRWILSRLQSVVALARKELDDYNVMGVMRNLERFIEDLSNWYVRRSRRRFWKSESDTDKNAAYATLYEALTTLVRVLAPVVPFLAEDMYQNLVIGADPEAPESVHLSPFPEAKEELIDERLEQEVDAVIKVVAMGRSGRNSTQLKVRQPLAEITVAAPDKISAEGVKKGETQILDELNIKSLNLVDDAAQLVKYAVKANFKVLGPKYGKDMGSIAKAVEGLDPKETAARVKAGESIEVEAGGKTVLLLSQELEIRTEQSEDTFSLEDHGWVVSLNTHLTEDLVLEGIARDFIRQVANFRKEADFKVDDRIHIYLETTGKVLDAVKKHGDFISAENLAQKIEHGFQEKQHAFETKIAGEKVRIALEKA